MANPVNDSALDQIFRGARSHNVWQDRPVSLALLQAVYDLARMGPTSANCSPARFVFLTTPTAKEKLKPFLLPANVEKVMTAPVTVIFGNDGKFYDKIPQLFPHNPGARDWFSGNAAFAEVTAMRNGTLQGAYFMVAARALGLDCGPMSGFDNGGVDRTFFAGTDIRSNFICAIGHGDPAKIFARNPRLSFADACTIL